jgi:ADP-heptose:LPS heptosyltransferase
MNSFEPTLERILENNQHLQVDKVSKILIIYEEMAFFIGDTCILFDKLRYVRSFFPNATVDMSFINAKNMKFYQAILQNNPNFDNITASEWDSIPFESYDLLICVTYKEYALLEFLHEKYRHLVDSGEFRPAVFSFSENILTRNPEAKYVFPDDEALREYTTLTSAKTPCELYITADEHEWANRWLESKGMKKNEKLVILLDSASQKSKLLSIHVYFDFLTWILGLQDTKVLIFDEKNIGKEEFYGAWLGEENMKNIIVSKKLSFREDLAILSASCTKMVFGPCTGLMHCASSIYNNFLSNGKPAEDIPVLMTYTGEYIGEKNNINVWWGNSPLVNCLLLKRRSNGKEIVFLKDLTEEEKNLKDALPCSEYTSAMLIDLLSTKFPSFVRPGNAIGKVV